MIPKKKRVTKDVFLSLMKDGKVISSPLFSLRFMAYGGPRYACVVPKGVEKRAVKRNSLRRKGYNVLRTLSLPPITAIFFFKNEASKATTQDIKNDMDALLRKVRY